MSDYNTPIKLLQNGSVLQVASGGSIQVLAGGSIQNAGGQSFSGSVAFSGSVSITGVVSAANGITLGGTLARWAYGTVGLTSGVGTIATGLTRVLSAFGNPVSPDAPGLGSFTTVVIDLSLAGAGSVIFRGGVGSLPYTNNGTLAWAAFGT